MTLLIAWENERKNILADKSILRATITQDWITGNYTLNVYYPQVPMPIAVTWCANIEGGGLEILNIYVFESLRGLGLCRWMHDQLEGVIGPTFFYTMDLNDYSRPVFEKLGYYSWNRGYRKETCLANESVSKAH